MTPTVSILCITYNHAAFIKETIEGFLMQQTKFEWEVLIGDDASVDGTEEIVRQFLPNSSITYFRHAAKLGRNGIANLQFLMRQSRGKYAILCEGDDYWTDPLKLQKQVDFLEANPRFGGCFHNLWVLQHETGEKIQYHPDYFKRWNLGATACEIDYKDILKANIGLIAGTNSFLYWNDPALANSLDGFTVADRVMQFFIAKKHGPMHYIPQIMGVYRKHGRGSTVGVNYQTYEQDYLKYCDLIDALCGEELKQGTNQLRFETISACFIYQYIKKNKQECLRLLALLNKFKRPGINSDLGLLCQDWLRFIKMRLGL